MVVAMLCLRDWSDWKTGIVKHASAGGLRTATSRAFSVRTYQSAMNRLEKMGWITRHIVNGSRTDFPVTVHNYKWVDEDGKTHILNPKPLTVAAVEKRRKRHVNTGASNDSASDGCGRNQPETAHEDADAPSDVSRAGKTAVEDEVRKAGEHNEKPATSSREDDDGCGRSCGVAATRSCLKSSINTCYPFPDTEGVPSEYGEPNPPVAERRTTRILASPEINTNINSTPVPLPEDFRPDASNERYARKQGLDLEEELAAFGDLHRSIGNERKNWQKVFRRNLIDAAPLRGHVVDLPDWMPMKEWKAYLAMRERIGRGSTKRGEELVIESLAKLREQGHSAAAILDRCTANNWTDVKRAASGMTTGSLTANVRAQQHGNPTFDALKAFRESK
jgi:hypothetical protein